MNLDRKDFLKSLGMGVGTSLISLGAMNFADMHARIFPPTLKEGGTIGMISPASSLSEDAEYAKVMDEIKKMGFSVKMGSHSKDHFGYFAGTDRNRAEDLNAMFEDNSIDAILPFRGGWGSNRILEFIDFDAIQANPKPLIGYSDITSLLLAIYAKTGLITFHGPVGKSTWTNFTTDYFRKAVMSTNRFKMQHRADAETSNGITTITPGSATGTLLGGNLSVLTSMIGSDYLPDWNNSILFLEDVGEDIYRIDRMLTQLRLSGVFDEINGLVFGKCTNCEVSEGRHFTLEQIVNNHIEEYDIPAFTGTNIGHIEDMFTLPVGIKARMDANDGTINVMESPTISNQT